jgi:hypothetical protein
LSHSKERREKICLNCNADLYGRYCHTCGQENIEPKETVWSLVSHFFYDITHYDGKFFSTTKYLITRPGFLPKEYLLGRRARYLHPIRMYVFTSAVFFLFLFSMFNFNELTGDSDDDYMKEKVAEKVAEKNDSARIRLAADKKQALATAESKADSAIIEKAYGIANRFTYREPATSTEKNIKKDTAKGKKIYSDGEYTSIRQYDSVQNTLPKDERDTWFERLINHKNIDLKNRYKGDGDKLEEDLMEKFAHTFPYLLFVSLPLYALYLKMLYWRRKQFFYVNHSLFLIYLYIFTFIDLLLVFGIQKLKDKMDWSWLYWLEALLLMYGVYYAYKAMRKFYGQGRAKTFIKFCILNTFAFFSLIFLFLVFFLFALYKF